MNKNEFLVPCVDGGVSREWSTTHPAIDFGWYTTPNTAILACEDGKVVDRGYTATMGNYICLEHNYGDEKRWSGYLHLKDLPTLALNANVVQGQQIGIKGTTGDSSGVHLHFAITKLMPVSTTYNWNYLSESSSSNKCDFNPWPYLRKSRNVQYAYADIYPGMAYLSAQSSNEGTYQKMIDSLQIIEYQWESGNYDFIAKVKDYIDSQL